MDWSVRTPEEAYELLARLGAAPWLIRHHELVVEAAAILVAGVASAFEVDFDQERVLLGAALHDCGKVVHPEEMRGPGSRHEAAGEALLASRGVPGELARVCRTHADWGAADAELEDLLVALADKLWKGRRAADLEERVVQVLAGCTARPPWEVLILLDPVLESAAEGAAERLDRARVPDER